jgi:hypothetical protein
VIEQGNDEMIRRQHWADYDEPRLLSGNLLTGVGVEIDLRDGALLAEAERLHTAHGTIAGMRRRVGHGLISLGRAVGGIEPPRSVERPTPAR